MDAGARPGEGFLELRTSGVLDRHALQSHHGTHQPADERRRHHENDAAIYALHALAVGAYPVRLSAHELDARNEHLGSVHDAHIGTAAVDDGIRVIEVAIGLSGSHVADELEVHDRPHLSIERVTH